MNKNFNYMHNNIDEGRDLIFLYGEDIIDKESLFSFLCSVADTYGLQKKDFSVTFCNNKEIQKWNLQYRNIDAPTDVLSFVLSEAETIDTMGSAGDIVISLERVKTQAIEQEVTYNEEIKRMLIHGILHLTGMDHNKDDKMIVLQESILDLFRDVEVLK